MMQPEVVIYTTPTCTYCAAAKRWFKEHGVAYTEHDVTKDPARAAELYRLTGQNAVPVIRVGQQVLVGYDPLQLAKLIPMNGDGQAAADAPGERLSLRMAAQALTPEKAEELGLPAPFGVVVGPVRPEGPAAEAGIEEGDVIVGIGGYTLQNLEQLQSAVAARQPGDEMTLKVWRGGDEREVTVKFPAAVETAPEPAPAEAAGPTSPVEDVGATSPVEPSGGTSPGPGSDGANAQAAEPQAKAPAPEAPAAEGSTRPG